jgi:hypothetical protein
VRTQQGFHIGRKRWVNHVTPANGLRHAAATHAYDFFEVLVVPVVVGEAAVPVVPVVPVVAAVVGVPVAVVGEPVVVVGVPVVVVGQ